MVGGFLAKSYGGLCKLEPRGSKRQNLSNKGKLHYKLYEEVEEALENQTMKLPLRKLDFSA